MTKIKINKESLDRIFEYKDGNLLWKEKPSSTSRAKVGDKANKLYSDPYGTSFDAIKFNGTVYKSNRLIYIMFHNTSPQVVVHLDGNKLNNRIENLKGITQSGMADLNSKNPSGYRGVYKNPRNTSFSLNKQWFAKAKLGGKAVGVGTFDDPKEAYAAVIKAEQEYKEQSI